MNRVGCNSQNVKNMKGTKKAVVSKNCIFLHDSFMILGEEASPSPFRRFTVLALHI